ncbi:hypothetical protein [Methylophilus sp. 5]|uniref:hypothetical protein n=1 Tax=Methylophilus sp. 5 TaxID=1112274 RepID=UPI000490A31B|nr:hypothetical protein [Methylophilus sp. 5]
MKKFLWLIILIIGNTAFAQSDICNNTDDLANAHIHVESFLKSIKEDQHSREIEIDKEVQATAQRLHWSREDQSSFFRKILSSPEFSTFEVEKQPLLAEIISIVKTFNKGRTSNMPESCDDVIRIQSIIYKIRDVNRRQYDFMSREINTAN